MCVCVHVCVCVCVCSQASRSQATLSCDSSYFSYWQSTIQASYAVMRQLLFLYYNLNWYVFNFNIRLNRKSVSFKNQQLKHPQQPRCFNGCHGNKYADFNKFRLISAKNPNANRMLFVCDIFNINLCEILIKNHFLCPKIHYYSLSINYLASILIFCTK